MPATDRELLALAAKAEGHGVEFDDVSGLVWLDSKFTGMLWDPLHNDGDGARLEAALGLDVGWRQFAGGVWVGVCGEGRRLVYATELFANHNGDKQAARRRATVRCAAAMAAPTAGG